MPSSRRTRSKLWQFVSMPAVPIFPPDYRERYCGWFVRSIYGGEAQEIEGFVEFGNPVSIDTVTALMPTAIWRPMSVVYGLNLKNVRKVVRTINPREVYAELPQERGDVDNINPAKYPLVEAADKMLRSGAPLSEVAAKYPSVYVKYRANMTEMANDIRLGRFPLRQESSSIPRIPAAAVPPPPPVM